MKRLSQKNLKSACLIAFCYLFSGSLFFTLSGGFVVLRWLIVPLLFFAFLKLLSRKLLMATVHLFVWIMLVFLAIVLRGLGGFFENANLVLCFLGAYYITQKRSHTEILTIFVKSMVVVAALSLIGHCINNYISPMTWLPQKVNSNDITFSVGYIYNFITDESMRNCGPFWEPGVYASWLILALVLLNYMPWIRRKALCNVIIILTILTTVSAAGYVLLLLALALLSSNVARNSKSKYAFLVPMTFVIIATVLFTSGLMENIISSNKFLDDLNADSLADSSRFFAVEQNWGLFLQNPVFGFGQSYVIENTTNVANTAGTFYLLSCFGIFGITYTLAILYGIFRQRGLTFVEKLLVAVIFFIIINKESQYDYMLNWVFTFILLSSNHVFADLKRNKGGARSATTFEETKK